MPDSPPFSPDRPTRRDLDPAALGLLRRHGAEIMLTARRYAATADDAEDAFQRAFEILLTRAPTANEEELVPWLKTVVKHEAYALRRARERQAPITADGHPIERPTPVAVTHEAVESRERGLQGAEALARLKPQQVHALVLKARGLTYRQICEQNGWSYTKTNRLLTEGRRAFRRRLAGIETGAECERIEPLLSRLADGEADADEIASLRPHLKTCLVCRSRLKEFRSTPRDVAALAPPGAAAVAGDGDGGRLRTAVESLLGLAHHKSALLSERAHALAEIATGQKIAAVAASAAALAGGGAAVDELATQPDPRPVADAQPQVRTPPAAPTLEEGAPEPAPADSSTSFSTTSPSPGASGSTTTTSPAPQPKPDPANEFDPSSAAAAATPAPAGRQSPSTPPSGTSPSAPGQSPSTPPSGTGLGTTAPSGAAPGTAAPGGTVSGASPPGSGEFTP